MSYLSCLAAASVPHTVIPTITPVRCSGGGPSNPTPACASAKTRPSFHKETQMRNIFTVGLVALVAAAALALVIDAKEIKEGKKVAPVLNFKMKTLDGKEADLSKYKGKVVLF